MRTYHIMTLYLKTSNELKSNNNKKRILLGHELIGESVFFKIYNYTYILYFKIYRKEQL